jgi:iron complex outermembrane receptor protein
MPSIAVRRVGFALLASASALAIPGIANAQDMQGNGREAQGDDQEIVVTARQRSEQLRDVPIAITALSERTIEQAGIRSVADYAQLVPNVTFENALNLGGNYLTIRGMTQVQYGPPPVAVVVDGVLQMSPYQFNVDGLDVAQIEVLKGPQGAIYGRNAIGGAINITTRRPTNAFEGQLRAGYATGEDYSGRASLSGPIIADHLLFSTSLSYTDRKGGQIVNATTGLPTDHYRDFSARARLLITPVDNWEFDLSYRYSNTHGPDPTFTLNPVDIGTDPNDTSFPPIANTIGYNNRRLHEASARVRWTTPIGEASFSVGFVDVFEDFFSDFDFLPIDLVNVSQGFDNRGFSQELRFTSNSDTRFRWIVGAYHVVLDNDVETIGYADLDGDLQADDVSQRLIDSNRTESYALFGQAAYDLAPGLELALAARYDHDSNRQVSHVIAPPFGDFAARVAFDEFQPKVTARYRVSPDVDVYASWGRGFRSGGFNSILASNRIYQPEVADTLEGGIKARIPGARLSVDLSAFTTDLSDAQFVFLNSATLTNETTNINQVTMRGFEAALNWRPLDRLTLEAGFGLTDTKIGTYTPDPAANGNRMPRVPRSTLNLAMTYNQPVTGDIAATLRVDYQRQSRLFWDILNDFQRAPLDMLNVRLTIGQQDEGWSVALWARNLLDEKLPTSYLPFEQTGHPTGLDGYQRYRGALFGVEVGYRF